MQTSVPVRIPRRTYDLIKAKAKAEDRPISTVIRRAFEQEPATAV